MQLTMPRMISTRLVGLGLAAVLTVAAAFAITATFQASAPGADLKPVGWRRKDHRSHPRTRNSPLELTGGDSDPLRSRRAGLSATVFTTWGGALVISEVNANAGVIDFGEKPMSITFDLAG